MLFPLRWTLAREKIREIQANECGLLGPPRETAQLQNSAPAEVRGRRAYQRCTAQPLNGPEPYHLDGRRSRMAHSASMHLKADRR